MKSIATQQGDDGQTQLVGGSRISKSHLRVEAYGTVDELNTVMGFARSLCSEVEINQIVKNIQRELFIMGSSLATPPESARQPPQITTTMVETLTQQVHHLEQTEKISFAWALPGENSIVAAFDMARTVCRRAERQVVRLRETGEVIDPNILPYLNRLSDLLWLLGRWLEVKLGVDGRLHPG
ncbi:cobalamin adenosyltransferase [Thioploca ingrica]|uniref:Corrinoid adenosyltransferase n=1 Tax=Thioploca ingrica TaxID=40754 RepID=A0A090BVX1_9GAMM|nr:cobalamin adenosyltransferase [Thioploca ingrica]